jgi:hypothetical protein
MDFPSMTSGFGWGFFRSCSGFSTFVDYDAPRYTVNTKMTGQSVNASFQTLTVYKY